MISQYIIVVFCVFKKIFLLNHQNCITFASVIELERHIEILLLQNDCVIVPQLGGFVAHHVDARYDSRDNMFLPPMRTLGFNQKLQINDSLLAQSYIEAYDISYPEAMSRINDDVNELKQRIENEGGYALNGIGVLSYNENGSYEFKPCEAGILTPDIYGLGGIEIDLLNNVSKKHAPMIIEPVIENDVEEEQKHHEGAKIISLRVDTLKNAVAIAAAILAIFFFSIPLTNGDSGDVKMSHIDTGMLQRLMPKQAVKGKPIVLTEHIDTASKESVETITVAKKDSLPVETVKTVEPVKQEQTEKSYFAIVLASKVSIKNASIYVEQLKKQGFCNVEILQKNGNKVLMGHYDNMNDAYQALNCLRYKCDKFEDAWVYEVKI